MAHALTQTFVFFKQRSWALGLQLAALLMAPTAHAVMSPLLPLSTGSASSLPLLEETLRDPIVVRGRVNDTAEAQRLVDEISQLRGEWTQVGPARKTEIGERLLENLAVLAVWQADVASGRLTGESLGDLRQTRATLTELAGAWARQAKSPQAKSRALWHVHVNRWLLAQNRTNQIEALKKLKSQKLHSTLAVRVDFLAAIAALDGNPKARSQAIAALRNMRSRLGPDGALAVDLALGRSLAGLNTQGSKVRKPENSWRTFMSGAGNKAKNLSDREKDRVLSWIISVWRAVEGRSGGWSQPPVDLQAFPGNPLVQAIVERTALEDVKNRRWSSAARKYNVLAKSQGANGRTFATRALDIQQMEWTATKAATTFEKNLSNARQEWQEDTNVVADVNKRHRSLVDTTMTRAASNNDRRAAIALATRWIETGVDTAESERVRGRIAELHVASGQHREAVAVWLGLLEQQGEQSPDAAKKRRWLRLAIRSQSILARWPGEAPWAGAPSGPQGERQQLLVIWKRLLDVDAEGAAWNDIAHVGLLEIAGGNTEAALALWNTGLARAHTGPQAAAAAGWMLDHYQRSSNWTALEALARLSREKSIPARHKGKLVDLYATMALALLEGGKTFLAAQDWPNAVKRLKEFTNDFGRAKRHDEGFFLLSQAQRGAGEHTDSIKTLQAFLARHPTSKYARQALLDGGDYSAPMAWEENVIWFHSKFLTQFARDGEAPRVRASLLELYKGRGLWAEAGDTLRATMRSASGETKVAAALDLMRIEIREGDLGRAAAVAREIERMPGAGSDAKAEALVTMARWSTQRKDNAGIVAAERALSKLEASSPGVQEGLGAVRFILADSHGVNVQQDIFNLELRSPLATLNQQYRAFDSARSLYSKVCEAGRSSWCAAALFKTARLSEAVVRAIEDINIVQTLAKSEVDTFNNRKNAIMDEMASLAESSDNKSLAVIAEGNTNPDWTQAIMWHNSSDWNFDRVSGKTGNAYVQWSPMEARP
jgi:hypothetical protein